MLLVNKPKGRKTSLEANKGSHVPGARTQRQGGWAAQSLGPAKSETWHCGQGGYSGIPVHARGPTQSLRGGLVT